MRAIPSDFDPAVVAAIDRRLDAVAAEPVAIGLAIESGSRAWGFASPDSDYDCRFLYVRPRAAYLSLWPGRDVIETPLDGLLDVGGWDIAKAVRLMVGGNAVTVEWLRSPVAYRGDPGFVAELTAFADAWVPRAAVRRHYHHLALRQREEWRQARAIKKLFYALRPAAALHWMARHAEALPPMHFPTLMAECDPPGDVAGATAALIEAKARTRELGTATMPPSVEAFIDAALALPTDDGREPDQAEARRAADTLFAGLIQRYAPPA